MDIASTSIHTGHVQPNQFNIQTKEDEKPLGVKNIQLFL